MKKVKVQELSERFLLYGRHAQMVNPSAYHFGEPPVRFFRDLLPLNLGAAHLVSCSVCQVNRRPLVVSVTEYHSATGEGILPLDADVLIHVAPAFKPGPPPLDQLEVFRLPRGIMVALNPGVWHHAPMVVGADSASTLIVLPERTYANDCVVYQIPAGDQVEIEWP